MAAERDKNLLLSARGAAARAGYAPSRTRRLSADDRRARRVLRRLQRAGLVKLVRSKIHARWGRTRIELTPTGEQLLAVPVEEPVRGGGGPTLDRAKARARRADGAPPRVPRRRRPITVWLVDRWSTGEHRRLLCTHVDSYRAGSTPDSGPVLVFRDEEDREWEVETKDRGIQWIPGHHDAESKEGRALIVAHALAYGGS